MEAIKEKIVTNSLKPTLYIPNSIRLDFSHLKIDTGLEKMKFILDYQLSYYNYHKLIDPQDLEQIFNSINFEIENFETSPTEDQEAQFLNFIRLVREFFTQITEDKQFLYFTKFKKLLEIVETTDNLDIILEVFEIIRILCKIRSKQFEIIILDLTDNFKYKMLTCFNSWFLGANGCNDKHLTISEQLDETKIDFFKNLTVSLDENIFKSIDEDNLKEENLSLNPLDTTKFNFNLVDLLNSHGNLKSILEHISSAIGVRIKPNSTFAIILNVRLCILKNLINAPIGTEQVVRLKLTILNIKMIQILKAIFKYANLNDKNVNIQILLNYPYYSQDLDVPLDSMKKFFTIPCPSVVSLDLLNICYQYYSTLEFKKEYFDKFENLLYMILEKVNQQTYLASKGVGSEITDTKNHVSLTLDNELLNEIVITVWLFYEEENTSRISEPNFSVTFDLMINLLYYYDGILRQGYNEKVLYNISKIFFLIKNEIYKDKEVVIIEILLDLLYEHVKLYNKQRANIKSIKDVMNPYIQFLYEIVESIFFYFIDPAKSSLIFNIPKITRKILEHDFWNLEELKDLCQNDPQFYQIYNILISLINDFFNEIPETLIQMFMKKFIDNGIFNMINRDFKNGKMPSDFDILSFYVNLLSRIHLHAKDYLDKEGLEMYLGIVFDLILHKDMITNNIRRFLSAYSHETLKHLAEELINLTNVHSEFSDVIVKKIFELHDKLLNIEAEIKNLIISSNNDAEFAANADQETLVCRKYGWFKDIKSNTAIKIHENLYLLQKLSNNLWKFITKFFDNYKTNIYKKFFEDASGAELNEIKFFNVLMDRKFLYYQDIAKLKKITTGFVKTFLLTSNTYALKKFESYCITKIGSINTFLKANLEKATEKDYMVCFNILTEKNYLDDSLTLDFSDFSETTYNLFDCFLTVMKMIEPMKYILGNSINPSELKKIDEKTSNDLIEFYDYVLNLQTRLLFYNRSTFEAKLHQAIDYLAIDNYVVANKLPNFINFNFIFKTIRNYTVFNASQIVFQICQNYLKLQPSSFDKGYIKLYEISMKITNYIEPIVSQNHYSFFDIFFLNYIAKTLRDDNTDYYNYVLRQGDELKLKEIECRHRFYSESFIKLTDYCFRFCEHHNKKFKNLLKKKQNPTINFSPSDVISIYMFDELFPYLCKTIKFFYNGFLTKPSNYFSRPGSIDQNRLLDIKRNIMIEKFSTLNNIMDSIKKLPRETFYALGFKERLSYKEPQRKKDGSSKPKNTTLNFNVSKDMALNSYVNTLLEFYDSLLLITVFEFEDKKKDDSEANKELYSKMARELGFTDDIIEKGIRSMDGNMTQADFVNNLMMLSNDKTATLPSERDEDRELFKKYQKENSKKFDEFSIYLFNNYLNYKECYTVLSKFWSKAINKKTKPEASPKKITILLQDSVLLAIRKAIGSASKSKVKSPWKIDLSDPRDALFYLISLYNELMKDQNLKNSETVALFTNLLEELTVKKSKIKRVQDSLIAIIRVLKPVSLTLKQKQNIVKVLVKMLDQHKQYLKNKEKYYFINANLLKEILELITKLINNDEELVESMVNEKENNIFRNIFRIEIFFDDETLSKELVNALRNLIENVVRQPHVITLLLESEIKSLFHRTPKISLENFVKIFGELSRGCNEIFFFIFNKLCKIVENEKNERVVQMIEGNDHYTRTNEVKQYINDFVYFVMKDLLYKVNRRSTKNEENLVFNDFCIADILFFQLMPRYPIFYSIKTKDKIPFSLLFFEKILGLHWAYQLYLQPIFYNSFMLVKDEKTNQISSISYLLRNELLLNLLNTVKTMAANVEEYKTKKQFNILLIMNITLLVLNISKVEHIKGELEALDFYNQIIQAYEHIALELKHLLAPNLQNILLTTVDILRRREVVFMMNSEASELITKSMGLEEDILLTVPTTFRYPLRMWIDDKGKENPRSFYLSKSNKIDYSLFGPKRIREGTEKDKMRVFFGGMNRGGQSGIRVTEIIRSLDRRNEDMHDEHLINEPSESDNINYDADLSLNSRNFTYGNAFLDLGDGRFERIHDHDLLHRRPDEIVEEVSEENDENDNEDLDEEDEGEDEDIYEDEEEAGEDGENERQVNYDTIIVDERDDSGLDESDEDDEDDDDEDDDDDDDDDEERIDQEYVDNMLIENPDDFEEIEEIELGEDYDEDESNFDDSENLTISDQSEAFESATYAIKPPTDFYSKEIFEKYPFIFPSNLSNESYIFYYDKINIEYQKLIIEDYLRFINASPEYVSLESDVKKIDTNQWNLKNLIDAGKHKQLLHNDFVAEDTERLRYERELFLQDTRLPRNGMRHTQFRRGAERIDTSEFKNKLLENACIQKEVNESKSEEVKNEGGAQTKMEIEETTPVEPNKEEVKKENEADMKIESNEISNKEEENKQEEKEEDNKQEEKKEEMKEEKPIEEQVNTDLNLYQNENQEVAPQNNLNEEQTQVQNPQNENPVNEDLQIGEDEEFSFVAMGLPENFLEIANIDPTFFNALPKDLKSEVVYQYAVELNMLKPDAPPPAQENRSRQESEAQVEMMDEQNGNMAFLTSLPPELREEVLLTCPDEFMMSLPDEVQEEARNLRANNLVQRNMLMIPPQEPQTNHLQTMSNKLKKSLKKNKQRDIIKKVFPVEGKPKANYKLVEAFIENISDINFKLLDVPIGLLSALLFNYEAQKMFYDKALDILKGYEEKVKIRFLTVLEKLSHSNFYYWLIKGNFDKLLGLIRSNQNNGELCLLILKTVVVVSKSAITFKNGTENCELTIDPIKLETLTLPLFSDLGDAYITEYLSLTLMILSFNKDNLEFIIKNLQKNIDGFAFNLNLKLLDILETSKDLPKEEYMLTLNRKITANYDQQVKLLKIFKLVEQLFAKSFNKSLQETQEKDKRKDTEKEKDKNKDKKEEEGATDQFEKIKEIVLQSFSTYFDQINIKRVFSNLFKVLNLFEHELSYFTEKKTVSKPFFLKLTPLIESFFIIFKILCDDEVLQSIKKNLKLKEKNEKKSAKISEYRDYMTSPKIEPGLESDTDLSQLDIETIFYKACAINKNVLNYLINNTPKLPTSPLSFIIKKAPKLVSFDIKRKYFNQQMQPIKIMGTTRLLIRRSELFTDSFTQISSKTPLDLRMKLHVEFQNEEGEDAGGVSREWFGAVSREIFNPDYALFIPAAHGYAYQPSPFSYVNPEHLRYFKFVGRIVAKALLDGYLLDAHFTKAFYKHMINAPLHYTDFEDYDPEYFKNLEWIMKNDVEILDLNFSYETNDFGVMKEKDLKPNGRNIPVTNENKHEYIKLLCYAKMANEIKPQIESFLEGLHEIIPQEILKIFDPNELELMISGLPEIDINDLKENTEYVNYSKDSKIIVDFWKVLRNFDENMKAGFLQFVTGTSKVPLDGFKSLVGIGGNVQKFQIHRAYEKAKLPTSHTCMNQLDLPEYDSYEELDEKLRKAILYGREGFGFL